MATRFRLSSAALVVAVSTWIALPGPGTGPGPVHAQVPADGADRGVSVSSSDCERLPGGNAPIGRIARLQGGISVRNLELTYFGKPLHQFTDNDYETLKELWPICETFDESVAGRVARKMEAVIEDAKVARQASLDWISETERELGRLPPGPESIRRVHDLWQEMLNREFEMLASDLAYIAKQIAEKRDELYGERKPRPRTLVSPFDPGPPEVRTLDEESGRSAPARTN